MMRPRRAHNRPHPSRKSFSSHMPSADRRRCWKRTILCRHSIGHQHAVTFTTERSLHLNPLLLSSPMVNTIDQNLVWFEVRKIEHCPFPRTKFRRDRSTGVTHRANVVYDWVSREIKEPYPVDVMARDNLVLA